ncbi:bifunctional diguanylate cyclase/phosphodiesterase [Halomonas cerina]|uniref:Diguanylate cyclase (GGDEF)-like protein n=1 Tax=Halomonas cerina TaxID=447424 RepID=A0A839VB88_9GAMM|nr:EAL domain-containing protein [Halomonas cerina]MBB3191368.1 diguanylate cyclase (GGDEF)-like protein [Halomonas cerina]
MTSSPLAGHRPRFSLTWRVMTLSSLLLLALVSLFTWLGHENLTRQFQESRTQHHMRQQQAIQLALRRSLDNLRQLAGLVAASPRLGPALETDEPVLIKAALASQWPTLQLETGIDEILVFDAAGVGMGTWGEQIQSHRPLQAWVDEVMDTERPLTALRCSTDCRQYAAVPVLVEGKSVGLVILSRSLADVIRQARAVSNSEVALLVTSGMPAQGLPAERYLQDWNGHLVALTQQEESLPVLKQASPMSSVHGLTQAPLYLSHEGRQLEIAAVRMEEDADQRSTGHFLLVSDITAQLRAINQDTRTLLVVGLIGWLAAELLLLVILLRPMARLRRIAGVLPTLARGGFAEVRSAIPSVERRLPDEIDVLEHTTLALSRQLEELEGEVQARGDQLAERVDELARERDFVGRLLDTARVFIIAQDARGRITLVNDYTLTVLELDEQLLIGRHFNDIFEAPDASPVGPLETGPLQEERTLLTQDFRQHTIAWYHAPLPAGKDGRQERISVGLDITERKAAEARLTWLAERDPLTALYNRRFFQDAVLQALQRSPRGAVLMLDLDQFRDVNELSGHQAGDRLLRDVAETLSRNLAHEGVIARLGGDEFAVLLEGADGDRAVKVAQLCNQLLDGLGFMAEGRRHRAIASIGIALFPMHGNNPVDLMASADVAMYKAKESGLQRWHLLSTLESAKDELQERVYWVERLRRALQDDDFMLMVQPIVRLEDRDVKHYEVLIRMREADGHLVSPANFIPVAERNGMIVQLDRWVLHHSLLALRQLQEQGISLAVNLSGQSLHDKGLEQFLADELTTSGADPHHLILEITETAAVTDFSTARGVLQAIRDLGCRTALDDFGVGFSSFHYLGQLPVDYIKIDGSFIRSLKLSTDSRVIVRAIADIAAGFGKQAIAEFVDQESLIPILHEYGITYGQGFHLGRPKSLLETFGEDVPFRSDEKCCKKGSIAGPAGGLVTAKAISSQGKFHDN